MKKIFIALLLAILLLGIGILLFLATFDANRYRPLIVKKMSETIGRPVQMDRVSLRWRGKIAVELQGVVVEPNLRADRIMAFIEPKPLMAKQLFADIRVEGGRLLGVNLLREVFGRLSVIPGLSERLMERLPGSTREKLRAADTLFEPIAVHVSVTERGISTGPLELATDSFALTANGITMSRQGTVSFPAQFSVDAALSGAMIRSVEELAFLADDRGRLLLPVFVEGKPPQVTVSPDLGYVTERLLMGKGQELLGRLLEKVLKE